MGKSILVAGGGTAGHVNPMLATAHELAARGHRVAALGTEEGLEADLVPRAGLELHMIPKVPLPRRPSGDLLRVPDRLSAAIRAAAHAIDAVGADAVVGFGGYVSTPAYFAARRRGVPVVVHEANARPGLANRVGARFAAAVAVTFPGTPLKGAQVTGLPLRPEIADLVEALHGPGADDARAMARMAADWPADAPVLVVTGGSLGAASLNAAVVEAIEQLVGHGLYVWHLTGAGKADGALRAKGDLAAKYRDQYRVEEYAHDMAAVLAAAGAVVCRAGAATVSEVAALGLPALYVPLPHGNGEQALNAASSVDAGAATVVRDEDLTPAKLALAAERMLLDPRVGDGMRDAARGIGITDGAARLVDMVEAAL